MDELIGIEDADELYRHVLPYFILNDNRMSISENVGALTKILGRLMTSPMLNAARERAELAWSLVG